MKEYGGTLSQQMVLGESMKRIQSKRAMDLSVLYSDSEGKNVDFYLSESRDKQAAKGFFKKTLAFWYVSDFM